MSVLIGIISYLPDNDLRAQRLAASRTQLEWLNKILPNEKIISVCQNYEADELPKTIEYIPFFNGIGPAKARNIILQKFYNSNYDWLFLLDDDTIFYDHYNPENFVHEIRDNPEKFKSIDAISAVEPEYHAYKKQNYDDKANLTHYKFVPRDLGSGSATSFIRNIKKYYNKEVYYPVVDPGSGESLEDVGFMLDWLKEGLNWYTMQTMIRKSLCFSKSSIFGTDQDKRNEILSRCLDGLCERYKQDGLYRGKNDNIVWKDFNDNFNTSKKILYVKRGCNIIFEEDVIPVEKKCNTKLLF